MAKKTVGRKSVGHEARSFATLLAEGTELSRLRAEYAQKASPKRRVAAQWAYDEDLAATLFKAALAPLQGGGFPGPSWPPGFAALAIDPEYAPALLTVGCYEYGTGRKRQGMDLLFQLTELSPRTP